MGKLQCVCGNILSDTCGDDAYAFTQYQLDEEMITENADNRGILECPQCGALAIEDPIDSPKVQFYIPENGKFNRLFRSE